MVGGAGEAKAPRTILQSAAHFVYFLPIYLCSTYFFMQVLLPDLLSRQRYTAFTFSFFALFAVNFTLVYFSGMLSLHHETGKPYNQISFTENKYHALVNGLFIPFMLFGITAGIKFSKKWFLQQRENEKLAKQKLTTELQLLKTSIHPRFLFHSLQTVEKHIDNSSGRSPELILQLSDLLSYILYENDKAWVELEKELDIIRGYINLEENRFEEKLRIKTEFPANDTALLIVPCLLLSFVETGFEYFLETKQRKPLLELSIRINESVLHYQMRFSKMTDTKVVTGDRFENIRKQLESQYQGLYQLKIFQDQQTISINLKLPLYSGDLIKMKTEKFSNETPALV